jgi:hypothetical protein
MLRWILGTASWPCFALGMLLYVSTTTSLIRCLLRNLNSLWSTIAWVCCVAGTPCSLSGSSCGIVGVWRDNHVSNFYTNIYCYYNKHKDELQSEDLKVAGCRFSSTLSSFGLTAERSLVSESDSESYITTDGQLASLSWNKASVWGLRSDFYFCQTFAGFLVWGALSDEKTGLSFTIAPGPRQSSHFRVRVPWDSLPYFTLSDSRLPFSLPPTIRRVTVGVLDPSLVSTVPLPCCTDLFPWIPDYWAVA